MSQKLRQDRGPDWPFDVEKLNPGDTCEFRFNAYPEWYRGIVVLNGMERYWHIQSTETIGHTKEGEIYKSVYIEHVRCPLKEVP